MARPFMVPPRDYQMFGARFVLDAMQSGHRAVMLGDEPGLGKTLQALLAADLIDARRILVIAPAIGRVSWSREVRRHIPTWLPYLKIPPFNASPAAWVGDDDIMLVLSYDVFSRTSARTKWSAALRSRRWDLLVLDEAHFLKNGSNRTQAIYGGKSNQRGLQASAERVLLLTGTPTPNHAGELYPHYRTFWSDMLSRPDGRPYGQTDWEERFCVYTDGPWGRGVHGSKNQDVLRETFAPVILKRTWKDVGTQLPPCTIEDAPLVITHPGDRFAAASASEEQRDNINRLMAVPLDKLLDTLHDEAFALATLRRLLGLIKADPAAEWARERLQCGVDKILLFAWHTDVIKRLAALLLDFEPVTIMGATGTHERDIAVEAFQTSPRTRVFIGQIRAAGAAITLTAAHHIGIVEPSWVPGENHQTIARAWRLGQTRPVLASFLYVPGSLDHRIMRAFRRKADEVLDLYQSGSDVVDATL